MLYTVNISFWLVLLLAFPAAGFVVRLFIIQHDCGHGSFFKSARANDLCGMFCSIFTFTPYHFWRKKHSIHHKSAGNLEHRGIGDIYTMTVSEYSRLSGWRKFKYRLYRNPLVLFIIFPVILFLIVYRFPSLKKDNLKNYRFSVYMTSLVIGLLIGVMIWLVGLKSFLLIQLPISIITSSTGSWLFFIQHQFEDTYWAEDKDWEFSMAAMHGSSYYKLPGILQWFTGNIGFHHIHHLSPRIPNYLLGKCQKENPELQESAKILTLRTSLKSMLLGLWDEKQKKLVSFRQSKRLMRNERGFC
ncbi:MAG TPA: fatty acid desaturase [Ignavibacteriaceae bacterium]|nr:fatty acid desaturase [Ignavibacteriaceae bacterium]